MNTKRNEDDIKRKVLDLHSNDNSENYLVIKQTRF